MWPVSYQEKQAISSSQNFLLVLDIVVAEFRLTIRTNCRSFTRWINEMAQVMKERADVMIRHMRWHLVTQFNVVNGNELISYMCLKRSVNILCNCVQQHRSYIDFKVSHYRITPCIFMRICELYSELLGLWTLSIVRYSKH
jgi:hypothetical protein